MTIMHMAASIESEAHPPVTIAEIDEEIQKHRAAIIRLQRRRNSLIPIAHLPPEVLSTIFLFNVTDGMSNFAYMFEPLSSPEASDCWINVTFVCHYWREVALHTPQLWSFWGNLTPPWLEKFASRSKAAPLHVRLCNPPLSYLHRIFGNPNIQDRIEELHAEIDATSMAALVDHFKDSSTPAGSDQRPSPIRSLRLRNSSQHSPHVLEWPTVSLSRQFPQLWRLEVLRCVFDWNSSIFTSSALTRLTIHQASLSTPPAMSQVLTILQKQACLETLDLGFGNIHVASGGVTHVHLPHLRKLQLSGPLSYCFDLMTHLSYPRASTVVTFLVQTESYRIPSIVSGVNFDSHVLNFLSQHYGSRQTVNANGNLCLPIIRHLSLKAHRLQYEADFWHDIEFNDLSAPPSSSCHIGIKLEWSDRVLERVQGMSKILCGILPLAHLHKLVVAGIVMTSQGWSDVFNVMEKLEELEIGGDMSGDKTVVTVINALKPLTSVKGVDRREGTDLSTSGGVVSATDLKSSCKARHSRKRCAFYHVPLPNLLQLHIRDVDFNAFESSISDLPSCLEARKQAHIGLSLLVLRRCRNLSSAVVQKYIQKNVVLEVDWDAEEEFDDDDSDASDDVDDYSDSDEFNDDNHHLWF